VTSKTSNEEWGTFKQFSSEGSNSAIGGKKRKREEEEEKEKEKDQNVPRPLKMKIMRSDSGEFQIIN
jgi:hypothetical protein